MLFFPRVREYAFVVEKETFIDALVAIGQGTRLRVLEVLATELGGVSAGKLAAAIGAAPNTMSFHLAILERAGLIERERSGRVVIYTLAIDGLRDVADRLGALSPTR